MIGLKFVLFLAFITLTSAGLVRQRSLYASHVRNVIAAPVEAEPFDVNPRYDYGYSINDALTGDTKTHSESRDGENVQGEYSIVEPDGTLRVVSYTAGKGGFVAVINRKERFSAPLPIYDQKLFSPIQNDIPVASFIQQQKVIPVNQQKVQVVQHQQVLVEHQQPQPVSVPQQPQPVLVQEPQPIPVKRPQPNPVQQPQLHPIPVQQPQPQPTPAQQPQPQPIPVQQPQPIPVQLPQPIPVQQPQPIPVQQQPPNPPPQQQPRPVQQQPRPVQQQQQFRPQPQPQPQPFPIQNDQQDPNQADDSPAIVVEASGRSALARSGQAQPRSSNIGGGSSFRYSSQGRAYDFNIAY